MKLKTIVLFLISNLVFIVCACNSNVKSGQGNPSNNKLIEEPDIINTKTKVVSKIRPNENLLINKTYNDTIQFLKYDEDYDYKILVGKKDKQEVSLVYDWDSYNKYNFKRGDIIKIIWKMDSLYIDCETKDLKERAIDAEIVTKNKSIHFLWREDIYHDEFQQAISTMVINEPFCKSMSVQEKAALGYIATFVGNECEWDGAVNESRSNLKCKILTALNLGYQCSDGHLEFLKRWFSTDENILNKLEICPTIPDGATIQSTFDEINLFNDSSTKTISITYKVIGMNVRESKNWKYIQTDVFKYDLNSIWLISSLRSKGEQKVTTKVRSYN